MKNKSIGSEHDLPKSEIRNGRNIVEKASMRSFHFHCRCPADDVHP